MQKRTDSVLEKNYQEELMYRAMYMVAHTVDFFIVKKNPVIGIKGLLSIFYGDL